MEGQGSWERGEREPRDGTLAYRVSRVEDRVTALEKHEPAVMANELKNLSKRVDGMTKAFVGLMLGIVLSAATFAITAFSIWGHG